jgi:hypothetical protein
MANEYAPDFARAARESVLRMRNEINTTLKQVASR